MTTQSLSRRPVSVYIVDDAANVRERLERLIESIGDLRVVGFAARADTAIEGIRSMHPDVVILDVALARGSGYDVLRSLNGDAQRPRVYMLSNFASQPYRRRAAELGARDFFDKSLELDDLRNCLRQGSQ